MQLLDLWRRMRGDFAWRWRVVFGWQLLVQLLGFIAITPLASWLTDRIVARSGSDVVSNYDIARFVLSLPGAVFVVVAVVIALAFYMSQLAGYAWIAAHATARQPVTLLGTIGAVAHKLGLLLRLGARAFMRVVLLALPFLAIMALVWFTTLAGRDVNYYLAEHPPEWRRALLVAAICGLGLTFVLIAQAARWLFVMPIAMFHDLGPSQVLLASERMLEGRLVRSITPLIAWGVVLSLLTTGCLYAGRQFTDAAFDWAGIDPQRVLPLVAVFTAVTIGFSFVYVTLQFAGHQFLATRLYTERREAPLLLEGAPGAKAAAAAAARVGRPLLLAVALVAAMSLLALLYLLQRLDVREDVAVTAHRGAALQAPENSMSAFRAAHDAGADFVELDVQRTLDGAIVVFHDGDLMRMGGDPRKVSKMTLAEIQAIDIGSRRGAAYAGEHVPTLAEVIDYARGKFHINIELKYNVPDPALAPAVIALLREKDFLDQIVITSLDHAALRQVERIQPDIDTGLIVTAAVGNVTKTDTDFVSLNAARATVSLIDQARAAGKQVHVWTVNTPEAMLRMIERDVDNIITDDPATLVRVMRDRNALSPQEQVGVRLRVLFTESPPELSDAAAVPAL